MKKKEKKWHHFMDCFGPMLPLLFAFLLIIVYKCTGCADQVELHHFLP